MTLDGKVATRSGGFSIQAPLIELTKAQIIALGLQLGVDFRITPAIAITPVIGASASMFLVDDAAMESSFTAVQDHRLNLYGFTGVLGRFDLGG